MRSTAIWVPIISSLPVVVMYGYWSIRNCIFPKRKYLGPMIATVMLTFFLSQMTGMAMVGAALIIPPGLPLLLVNCFLFAALPEETVIFMMLLTLFQEKRWTANVADSMAAGLSLGLGLALIENIFFVGMNGDTSGVGLIRGLISVPAHGCWGLIMAACLRYSLEHDAWKPRCWRWAALVLPVLLHSVYDIAVFSSTDLHMLNIVFASAALMVTGAAAIVSQDYLQAQMPRRQSGYLAVSRTWYYRLGCLAIGALFVTVGLAGLTGHLGIGQDWKPLRPLMPILPVILGGDIVCLGVFSRPLGSFLSGGLISIGWPAQTVEASTVMLGHTGDGSESLPPFRPGDGVASVRPEG